MVQGLLSESVGAVVFTLLIKVLMTWIFCLCVYSVVFYQIDFLLIGNFAGNDFFSEKLTFFSDKLLPRCMQMKIHDDILR